EENLERGNSAQGGREAPEDAIPCGGRTIKQTCGRSDEPVAIFEGDDCGDECAFVGRQQFERAVCAGRDEEAPARMKDERRDINIIGRDRVEQIAARQLPKFDLAVAPRRSERLTIGANGELGDAGCVSCKGAQALPRLHVPELDAVITFNQIIGAAGNKRLAIWTEHECGDAARVAGERAQELARVCVPELDGLVPTCRRKLLPVGTEHERRDDTRVPTRRLYELALTQIPQFDRLLLVNER